MSRLESTPYSLLDLVPIRRGGNAGEALARSLELAQHADGLGYRRYWVAEHHNIPGVASSATSVVIGHIAAGTSRIRVGSGGIMLPNHAPLVIAEQFGTLSALFPGRIDLGLGRAPGGDAQTARALRRTMQGTDSFPQDVVEIRSYFRPSTPGSRVRAIPGEGQDVPLWILGSSDFGAALAAELGLPYAFASHFAPDALFAALDLYRSNFRPSEQLQEPYAMVGVNVIAADTRDEAHRQFTTVQQSFLNLIRGMPGEIPPPIETMEGRWSPAEKSHVDRMTRVSVVGDLEDIRKGLSTLIAATGADELMLTAQLSDHPARLRSFELAAEAFGAVEVGTMAETRS